MGDDNSDAPVLFSRTVAGGMLKRVRSSCVVRDDGSVQCSANDDHVAGQLEPAQVALLRAICWSSGFDDLPDFVEGPMTRTDPYTWTYRVGDREVKMRDVERAGEAVPAPLHVIEALAATLTSELNEAATATTPEPATTDRAEQHAGEPGGTS